MALKEGTQLLQKLKSSYNKGDYASAKSTLSQLKLKLIQLTALPPIFEATPTAQQELLLAREVLEQAVLLSLKLQDAALLERSFVSLKTFYADTRNLVAPSQHELPMVGLNLLRLLVENRIAEFHTELELIPPQGRSDRHIQQAIQLEQWLMEGAYNKVLAASQHLPKEFHGFYSEQLTATVRDEIASCSEKAYARLRLQDAQKLMRFKSSKEIEAYANEHGWDVQGGYITFQPSDVGAAKDLPAMGLIQHSLVYAKELERIV